MTGNKLIQHSAKIVNYGLLCALPLSGYADYRTEINASGSHNYQESGTFERSQSTDTTTADITVFLSSVSTEEVPLAEAAFLSKASSVTIEHSESERDYGQNIETEATETGLSIDYVAGEKYIYGISYSEGDYDYLPGPFQVSVAARDYSITNQTISNHDFKRYGLKVGRYLSDYTALTLSINQLDTEQFSDEYETYLLNLRTVTETYGGNAVAGNITFGVISSPLANTTIHLDSEFDYYFTNKFSIGGAFTINIPNNETSGDTIYGLNTTYFITENIALSANAAMTIRQENRDAVVYGTNSVGNPNIQSVPLSEGKIETVGLKLTGRF